MLSLARGTNYVLPLSAPPSLFRASTRSGSADTAGFQRLFDMSCSCTEASFHGC